MYTPSPMSLSRPITYVSQEPEVRFKEYGRAVQQYARRLLEIEDREERSEKAKILIELMRRLNPNSQVETEEENQKLWDHLHVMCQYQLEVDGPYPKPGPESEYSRPKPLPYFQPRARYKHYGHNLELLVQKALEMESEEDREAAAVHIARLMKNFYSVYAGKDLANDELVLKQLTQISHGKLSLSLEKVQAENLFHVTPMRELPEERQAKQKAKQAKYGKFKRKRR